MNDYIEKQRIQQENLKLGKSIAKFMNRYKNIGIFGVGEDTYRMKWTKSMFHFIQYNDSELFSPTFSNDKEDNNILIYDAIILLEIKYGQKKNSIIHEVSSIIKDDKFIPMIKITYNLITNDEQDVNISKYIDNGISAWKVLENKKL